MFFASIRDMSRALKAREVSCEDIARSYLDTIEKKDGKIHAYLEVYSDEVIDHAQRLDKNAPSERSELWGVPIAIKDNMLIRGHISSAGSKILEHYHASYDATAVARLRAEGVLFLGRTNMDEFAMGSSTENSAFGPTKNPHDLTRVPGGSSGGSAAAVASGMAPVALGSDTGGSIRQPAAFCGVVGFKPSYGGVSRSGLIAMASSLDQIGPFARSVEDARIVFQAFRGPDELDSTTADVKPRDSEFNVKHMRIGVPKEYFGKGLDPDVEALIRQAIKACESLGAEIREISLPHAEYALPSYYIAMPAEVSSNLARFDGIRYGHSFANADTLLEVYERSRGEGFGPEVKRRIMLGTFVLSHGYYDAYYLKAQKVRRLVRDDFEHAFADVDVILGPTSPTPAFHLGEKSNDPLQMYLEDIYTVPANLAGVPAISVPAGVIERDGSRLPVGLQLTGKWFRDDDLLRIAEVIEERLPKISEVV